MPVCLSPLSAVRLSKFRSYTLHQTEYSHSPCQKQWLEACTVPASWYLPELLLWKYHHRNAIMGIHLRSARTVDARRRRAASASIYNFIEPSSSVLKLLWQRVFDGRKIRPYYSPPHGECHKGVGGRQFVTPEKSATQIPTLFFLCVYGWWMWFRARCLYMCKKATQCPRRDACALWHGKVPRLQLQNEGTA